MAQAQSAQEIQELCSETSAPTKSEDLTAKRIEAAVHPSEIAQILTQIPRGVPVSEAKRKFPYVSGDDGFLKPISNGDDNAER
jgi:hypothetical protein